MVGFDADTVLTGSADGLIRIVGILPNALLGVVGEHAQARPKPKPNQRRSRAGPRLRHPPMSSCRARAPLQAARG
jgi:hypothetical protein